MRSAFSFLAFGLPLLAWSLAPNASQAAAAGACRHTPAPAGAVGKRVALIVGNGAYANGIPALANPTHDAEAVAKAVGGLGFEVYLATNDDSTALQKCVDEAQAHLAGADVAMLYYSGHGIQIKDENYLVATDAATGDLSHGFVPVQPIVDALQKEAKATLVLLDACRDNPMAASTGHAGLSVSTGRGLARVGSASPAADIPVAGTPGAVQARGLMVAYATSPNAVAQDGTGELSPFTAAFVKTVGTSGYSIQRVMSDVTKSVGDETDYTQTPWMKSSLTDELKLGGGQTLDDAQSVSDNHAARSAKLLQDGHRDAAIAEALKGLPSAPDEAALKRFAKAYLALYTAVQSRDVALPLGPGHAQVAVSTADRVAVFEQNADIQSGTLALWSASEKKVVASPPVTDAYKLMFSAHGKFLATQSGRGAVILLDGHDGSKMFELRGGNYLNAIDISPDEKSLLLVGNGFVVVDIATHKPVLSVKAGMLTAGAGRHRSGTIAQAMFAGDDKVCFILNSGISKGSVGVYDLKEKKTTHLRDVDNTVTVLACDPAGKHMIRTFAVNTTQQGMEIWDFASDKVTMVKGPIFNILGVDPKGDYAGVLAFSQEAEGLYDLATGRKGHPPTVPDGFKIDGSRVHDASGALINQDLNPNAWRDWPDETLYGPALVKKAMDGLTPAQRDEVARERITFVAGNP